MRACSPTRFYQRYASSSDIHPLSDLEEVFLYFFGKFQALPSPRSVAEARIKVEECDQLARWLCGNWQMARDWLDSTWQDDLGIATSASRQEMLGSLLLILASEVCRRSVPLERCNGTSSDRFDRGSQCGTIPGKQLRPRGQQFSSCYELQHSTQFHFIKSAVEHPFQLQVTGQISTVSAEWLQLKHSRRFLQLHNSLFD
jgi:hypothetical protein